MTRSKDAMGMHLSLSSSTGERVDHDRVDHDRAARELRAAPHLNADDIAQLSTALERSLCESEIHESPRSGVDADLRKALRIACAKARLQRVRAEQLLVDLKQLWLSTPTMESRRTEDRLNRIVTACIDEYYAGENSAPS